ncbi:MAG: UPF0175 family protein [Candidatus Methylumidiphilus sp.]
MHLQLKQEFDEILEPFGTEAASFFLAASLYHARRISFSKAAALADLSFDACLYRLQEHFGTGFHMDDDTVQEDLEAVKNFMARA